MPLLQAVNLSTTDWVIISALASVIVVMAVFIMKVFNIQQEERKEQSKILLDLHETHRIEQKENLTSMVAAITGNTKALEGANKVLDKVEALIQTVNSRLIKMDSNG